MNAAAFPEPMSSADCDLRGLTWMPLDVGELARSSLAAKATGDGFRAAVLLWCASWQQVPAGSLPNDEAELAFLAGFGRDLRSWKKARDWALHKFVMCADGRLYHPIICEKAMEALPGRLAAQEAKANTTERKRQEREDRKRLFDLLRQRGVVLPYDTPTSQLRKLTSPDAIALLPSPDGDEGVTEDEPVTPEVVTGHGQVTAKRERGRETEKEILDDAGERDWSMIKGLAEQLRAVTEAAGIPLDSSSKHWPSSMDRLKGWLAKGYELERDIRPAIDRSLKRLPDGDRISSIRYIEHELFSAKAKARVAPPPPAEPTKLEFAKSGEPGEMADFRAAAASTMQPGPYRRLLDNAELIAEPDGQHLLVVVGRAVDERDLSDNYAFRLEPLVQRFLQCRFMKVVVRERA